MYIRVTKTFARFINKTAKEMGFKAHAKVITIPTAVYEFCTGTSLLDAGNDYDYTTGTYCRVIEVSYPYKFYAVRKLLTTYELTREFRQRGVKTLEELKEMLRDMLEV